MKEMQIKTGNRLWRAQTCVSQIPLQGGTCPAVSLQSSVVRSFWVASASTGGLQSWLTEVGLQGLAIVSQCSSPLIDHMHPRAHPGVEVPSRWDRSSTFLFA